MAAANSSDGPAVVLVADRTLSGDYTVLFEGIFATMQTTSTPALLMRRLLSPSISVDARGSARAAVLGLRRIEAALIDHAGLSARDVVVTTPEHLGRVLGPSVKIVAVTSGDPLGRGMSNTTTHWFCGGRLYTEAWTEKMLSEISAAKARYGFTVVGGGPGAWQWAQDPETAARQGLDVIFEGYFEAAGPELFASILAGKSPPAHVKEPGTCTELARPIRRPSLMGALELSRGCGNGCAYCTSSDRPMAHLSPELILADLETNLSGNVRSVVSGSEDFFRYGSQAGTVNFEAMRSLLEQMRAVGELDFMQIDHANIASVLQYDDAELAEIRRLLTWRKRCDYLWVNLGVESANGRLVAATGGRGKIAPFDPADWAHLVVEAAERLDRAGFFPVFSIVLGLPGETPDDVAATRLLVDDLSAGRCVIFPVFYVPAVWGDDTRAFTTENMRRDHLDLFTACYELNFQRVPKLFADNQRAGGISWFRRAAYQSLGHGEVMLWRRRFKRLARRCGAAEAIPPA